MYKFTKTHYFLKDSTKYRYTIKTVNIDYNKIMNKEGKQTYQPPVTLYN